MKRDDRKLKAALALATAAFVSMPFSMENGRQATAAAQSSGKRIESYRKAAGPLRRRGDGGRTTFSVWRPSSARREECFVRTEVRLRDVRSGRTLRRVEAVLGNGEGETFEDLAVKGPVLLGLELRVLRPPGQTLRPCPMRVLKNGTVVAPLVRGTLQLLDANGQPVADVGTSDIYDVR